MQATITAIRQALRTKYGTRKYRIDADGTIHVYGRMPNATLTGWYLLGRIDSRETLQGLGLE